MKTTLAVTATTLALVAGSVATAVAAPGNDAALNHPESWGADCYKVELANGTGTFELEADAELIVVKAGRDREVLSPAPAGTYGVASGKDVSHVIVCPGDGYPGGGGSGS